MAPLRALHCPHFGAPVRVGSGRSSPLRSGLLPRGAMSDVYAVFRSVESVVLMSHSHGGRPAGT